MSTSQRLQAMPPRRAEATTGVMPPVSSTVEARRLSELRASMTARASGVPCGTPLSARACSYTCRRMAVRVVAEGSSRVSSGNASSICT